MSLRIHVETQGLSLTPTDEQRIEHGLQALERRLEQRPDPSATLILKHVPRRQTVEASLRVQLGPLGAHLIAHECAETVSRATHQAIVAIERQLERHVATQRGEPTFGVPSRRRLPESSSASSGTGTEPAPHDEEERDNLP